MLAILVTGLPLSVVMCPKWASFCQVRPTFASGNDQINYFLQIQKQNHKCLLYFCVLSELLVKYRTLEF